jgi:hypothetical protein
MNGRSLPRQRTGAAIPAANHNRTAEAVERLLRLAVGPGLALSWLFDAPQIRLAGPAVAKHAKTPGGGIPVMSGLVPGSAVCRLYNFDPVAGLSDSGIDVSVFNSQSTTTAVGANKIIQVKLIDGSYFVDVEPC